VLPAQTHSHRPDAVKGEEPIEIRGQIREGGVTGVEERAAVPWGRSCAEDRHCVERSAQRHASPYWWRRLSDGERRRDHRRPDRHPERV